MLDHGRAQQLNYMKTFQKPLIRREMIAPQLQLKELPTGFPSLSPTEERDITDRRGNTGKMPKLKSSFTMECQFLCTGVNVVSVDEANTGEQFVIA